MKNFGRPDLNFGLRLRCIEVATHRMEIYTPRNLNIAIAMVEGHALSHGRGYEYRIEDTTPHAHFDPIRLENI